MALKENVAYAILKALLGKVLTDQQISEHRNNVIFMWISLRYVSNTASRLCLYGGGWLGGACVCVWMECVCVDVCVCGCESLNI